MKLLSLAVRIGLFGVALSGCGGNVTVDHGSGGDTGGGGGSGTGGSGLGGAGTTITTGSGPTTGTACDGAGPPIDGLVSAISTFNAGSGDLEIDLSSAAATCGDPYFFPSDCTKAWRLRLVIPSGALAPGTYPLSLDSAIFAYLDGQAPGGGASCQNTGADFAGTLTITEVGKAHISGGICDSPLVNGSFTTTMCASCLGVGQTCQSDGQCCQKYCDPSSNHCAP